MFLPKNQAQQYIIHVQKNQIVDHMISNLECSLQAMNYPRMGHINLQQWFNMSGIISETKTNVDNHMTISTANLDIFCWVVMVEFMDPFILASYFPG